MGPGARAAAWAGRVARRAATAATAVASVAATLDQPAVSAARAGYREARAQTAELAKGEGSLARGCSVQSGN